MSGKNVIVIFAYNIIVLICGLIVSEQMLSYFRLEYNGVVVLETQFVNYITLLIIGGEGPIRIALHNSLANNENKKTSGILK